MSRKLLVISGPTSTGKTEVASIVARKYGGELVSADSCQVYKGMDIGTGKDQEEDIRIHMIDVVEPSVKYNVADYQKVAIEVIEDIFRRGKLPILVGVSGFYIDSVINSKYSTFSIKPNKILRKILGLININGLKLIYKLLDKKGFERLNHSDANNPYRLVRKIEIKLSKNSTTKKNTIDFDILHIKLTAPLTYLYQKIDKRVEKRMEMGFVVEIKNLLNKYKWSDPGMQIAAYKCLKPYFSKDLKEGLDECLTRWKYEEHCDARRQGNWYKNKKDVYVYDITRKKYLDMILKRVSRWYN